MRSASSFQAGDKSKENKLTGRKSHATLSSSSERSSDNRVESKVGIGVGHEDAVVYRDRKLSLSAPSEAQEEGGGEIHS